ESGREIPRQILINIEWAEKEWVAAALSEQSNRHVSITCPQRGKRMQWLQLAIKNAQQTLASHLSSKANLYRRLEELQHVLGLENIPQRLECFDISHTFGEAAVASCVVFGSHGPLKNDYRRFNIKNVTPGDDYAALHQALSRRYTHLKETEGKL